MYSINMDSTSESDCNEFVKPSSQRKSHICPYESCGASFYRPSKLNFHIKRHTGERPFVCDEPNCNKSYLYPFHLRRHKNIHHNETAPVQQIPCPYQDCDLNLANKYTLKKHIKAKHEKCYPFNCYTCKQGFHRKQQLLQHSYLHTGVYPFKCEICDKAFLTIKSLNRHKRTHTSYACECKKTFERWSALLAHKKHCEVARPKCNVCNQVFKSNHNLKAHLEIHLRNKEDLYLCGYEGCNRYYAYSRNLVYHINRVHKRIALPKIPCTVCGCSKTFTQRQKLKLHILKIHSDTETKVKKLKKPRKDKGVSKTNYAKTLSGFSPNFETQASTAKEPVVVPQLVRNSSLTNCANELRSSDTDDSETYKNFTKVLC